MERTITDMVRLLTQETKFNAMSDGILEKIDFIYDRLDELERTIDELMAAAQP